MDTSPKKLLVVTHVIASLLSLIISYQRSYRQKTMPIYRLSRQLAGSASVKAGAEKFTGRKDESHTFWDRPESDDYRQQHDWNDAAGIDSLPHKKETRAGSEGRSQSFIEREIDEQRRRQKELADAHKYCAGGHGAEAVTRCSGSEHTSPPAEHLPQRRDSGAEPSDLVDDNDDHRHPGESRIVRELLEQQKRETELRRHWHEMGYKLNDDDDDDTRGNDDTFQRNDDKVRSVQQEKYQKAGYRPAAALDLNSAEHLVNSSAKQKKQADTESSRSRAASYKRDKSSSSAAKVSVAASVAVPAHAVTTSSKTDVRATEETAKPAKKIVLPYDGDDDDGCTTRTRPFEPQPERLLDREVRAAREREQALRLLRGLTTTLNDDARRSVEVAVEVTRSRSRCAVDPPERPRRERDASTRRYAESRLRAELQHNRQRELELRDRRIVHDIPDEPAGQRLGPVDVLSSEASAASKRHPASAAARRAVVEVERHPHPYEHAEIKVDNAATGEATGVADKPSDGEMSRVLRTYEHPPYLGTNDTLATSTRVPPQSRIEDEIAEYRQRESELRKLREMARYERTASHDDVDASPSQCQHAPAAGDESTTAHDVLQVPGVGRRTTVAGGWRHRRRPTPAQSEDLSRDERGRET